MKIVVNGREYGSTDEMPENERRLYERALATVAGDGANAGSGPGVTVRTKTRFVVNGKEYGSLDELPADVRSIYDAATKSGARRLTLTASLAPGMGGWLVAGIVLGAGLVLAALAWMSGP